MSRKKLSCAFVVLSLLSAVAFVPALHADVKKREKTVLKFEGMLGRVMGMAGGSAMKDGLTSTVAVKGNRKATLNDQTGQIIDLSEEKIYDIDFKKKEYRVMTFDQLRAQIKKAQADAAKAAKDMPAENRDELDQPGKEVEVSFDVKATGQTRTIAGHPAKQVIVTITAHEKGKTLEEGGGMVMTNETWVGPRIPALNEVALFDSKFIKAVYGDSIGAMAQQFAGMAAMYPSLQKIMAQTEEQMKKLDGTPLLLVQKTETVKSTAAMAEAPAAPASGGGLGGALARRMMGNKKPEQRSLLYTSTSETLSIDPAASDLDVALPTGLKEKMSETKTRRAFLKAVPVAVAGAVATKTFAQQAAVGPISRETVDCAEAITGLDFHTAEEEAIARGLNANLSTYQQLRQIEIPHDTEVALTFRPYLPGEKPKGPATPGRVVRYAKPAVGSIKRPANLEDVAFWPVTKLAALLERKLVSSTELTQMYLARLKRYQPTLLFAVTITEELALQQASEADKAIASGKYKGPLHGIPWGAKDLLATKGIATTFGAEPYMNQVPDYDATVVERLRDAGAVLVAKLTMGALAQGDQWFGGRTRNPWNPQGGASGSSAGPGSATAAGCVGFSIGTETRGSIISPTSVNGVVGLRPTYGRVSRYGAMELSWTMDKIGPMCRSVEDCVLVLNAIYGPDGRDESVADASFTWNADAPLAGYRIGYVRSDFEAAAAGRGAGRGAGGGGGRGGGANAAQQQAAAAERLKNLQDAMATLQKLGAKLEPVDLPDYPANALGFVLSVEAAAAFDDLTRSRGTDLMTASNSTWGATFRSARFVPAVEYLRAQRIRTLLMREWDTFMDKHDAFISSNNAGLAATNLTGHPAIALKCGFANNLPQPLMVTGRLYDEATICRIAHAYEQATEWKDRHPTLPA